MCKVNVIARSFEKNENNEAGFEPSVIADDLKIMSGKAAGICYSSDSYLDEGIKDVEKARKRSEFNAKSGHYSVYEHGHVSFIIHCSKAVAMVLNSTRLYATSEKSARYTFMKAETQLENDMYSKWKGIFIKLISAYYDSILNEKDIEKLAMENARYMISVFTETSMEFTVPFGRAILLCEWLDDFANWCNFTIEHEEEINREEITTMNRIYLGRLAKECIDVAAGIREAIGIDAENPIIKDHKNMGIELFSFVNSMRVAKNINTPCSIAKVISSTKKDYYGNIYTSNYRASFASIAQLQRHRTLTVELDIGDTLECYIPDIIKSTPYEREWVNDFYKLIDNGVCPQSVLMNVTEEGRFEDFVLKCKERLCSRAQYETMRIVQRQVQEFLLASVNLCTINKYLLGTMVDKDGTVHNRCKFDGYTCKEPCKFVKAGYIRNV